MKTKQHAIYPQNFQVSRADTKININSDSLFNDISFKTEDSRLAKCLGG